MADEKLMNHVEAAEYIGSTPGSVRWMCSMRRIPHVKLGRSVRFIRSDLDRWIEERRVPVETF